MGAAYSSTVVSQHVTVLIHVVNLSIEYTTVGALDSSRPDPSCVHFVVRSHRFRTMGRPTSGL